MTTTTDQGSTGIVPGANLGDAADAMARLLTFLPNGFDAEGAQAYVLAMSSWESPSAIHDAIDHIVGSWTHGWRPTLAVIREAYDAAVLARASLTRALSAVRCNGMGWIETADERRPCPTCSPALESIWDDRRKVRAWREGASLYSVVVGNGPAEEGTEKPSPAQWLALVSRQKCNPVDHEPIADPAVGRAAAVGGYLAECAAQGRQPNAKTLDSVGRLVASGPIRYDDLGDF